MHELKQKQVRLAAVTAGVAALSQQEKQKKCHYNKQRQQQQRSQVQWEAQLTPLRRQQHEACWRTASACLCSCPKLCPGEAHT